MQIRPIQDSAPTRAQEAVSCTYIYDQSTKLGAKAVLLNSAVDKFLSILAEEGDVRSFPCSCPITEMAPTFRSDLDSHDSALLEQGHDCPEYRSRVVFRVSSETYLS
jgi:hypothetical protein